MLLVGCNKRDGYALKREQAEAATDDVTLCEALDQIRESLSSRKASPGSDDFDREAFVRLFRFSRENLRAKAGREAALEACILLHHPGASDEERERGREYLLEETSEVPRDWRAAVAPVILLAFDMRFSHAEGEEKELAAIRSALAVIDRNMKAIEQYCSHLDARAQECLAGLPMKGDGNFATRVLYAKAALLRKIGHYGKASDIYRSLAAKFPRSIWAERAKRQLTSMELLGERPGGSGDTH